jgi:hypothetical protein
MAVKLYEESNIAAIAEAIRAKNGTTNTYTTAQMASAIADISAGGGIGDLAILIEQDYNDAINTTSFVVPEGITRIKENCFDGWDCLESITFPSTLQEIRYNAFYGCTELASLVFPASLTRIYDTAFEGCSALTSVTFKGKPTRISSNAFSSCNNLKTINVPWAQGAVSGAPWGATKATINYNVK